MGSDHGVIPAPTLSFQVTLPPLRSASEVDTADGDRPQS